MRPSLSPRPEGFTLIEVLITLFVVAIGLLAAAGMQAASKKASFDAIQRSNATALAQEMIERMRSNPNQLALYVSEGSEISSDPDGAEICNNKFCTSAQMVEHDLNAWWAGLDGAAEAGTTTATSAGGLRRPTGCIQFPDGSQNLCRVTVAVAWRGLTPLSDDLEDLEEGDPLSNICGSTQRSLYDDADSGSAEDDTRFRRVLVINTNLSQGGVCP